MELSGLLPVMGVDDQVSRVTAGFQIPAWTGR